MNEQKKQVFNRLTADVVKLAQFLNPESKKLSLDYKSEWMPRLSLSLVCLFLNISKSVISSKYVLPMV